MQLFMRLLRAAFLEKFVRLDGDRHVPRLRVDEIGQREDHAIDHADDHRDDRQKAEQAGHDRGTRRRNGAVRSA